MSLSGQAPSTILPVSSASSLAPRHCHAPPRTITNQHQTLLTVGRRGWCFLQTPSASAFSRPSLSRTHLSLCFQTPSSAPSPPQAAPHHTPGGSAPWGLARTDAGAPLTSKAPSEGANSARGSYMRGKEKPRDMGKESLRCPWWWTTLPWTGKGATALVHPARAAVAGGHCTFCFPWQSSSVSDDALPHFSLLIPHAQISTGVLRVFSCCNAMGEFHPQRTCRGKRFINRKRTDLQPTRWSGKAYVLDLQ